MKPIGIAGMLLGLVDPLLFFSRLPIPFLVCSVLLVGCVLAGFFLLSRKRHATPLQ